MAKAIGGLGERLCLLCAALICGLILAQSLQTSLELPLLPLLGALCAGAVLWAGLRLAKCSDLTVALILLVLRAALALLVIFLIGAEPIQDFQTMFAAAQDVARGGRDYLDSAYFYNWAYQTGFVFYESLPLRLFGPGQFPLQALNALWLGGTGALVWLLSLRLLPRRPAAALSLLYALYPAPYFLAAVLTNQHLAVFLFYLVIYLLLSRERLSIGRSLLIGALLALGNAVRPIGIVVLLAAVCFLLLRMLLSGGRDWLGWSLLLVGSYAALCVLLSLAVQYSGLNPEGLSNNQPMWKFVLGLNQDSDGSWNQADYDAYLTLPPQEANAAMREALRERLGVGAKKLAGLALRKSMMMWGDNEYMYWGFGHLDPELRVGPLTVNQWTYVLARGDKGIYLVAFALALLGLLSLLLRGTEGKGALFLAVLLCGYYSVHLIVEVQARYRYFLLPAVFLLGGYGLSLCLRTGRK